MTPYLAGAVVALVVVLLVHSWLRKDRYLRYEVRVINLDRRPDRRAHAANELRPFFRQYTRHAAVDGNALPEIDERRVTRFYDTTDNQRWDATIRVNRCLRMSPGEVGCALSHLQVWEDALARDAFPLVVFEDDLVLAPDFGARMRRAMAALPADADLLYLGCIPNGLGERVAPSLRRVIFVFGAFAYVLTRSGARKLVGHLPIDRPVDNYMGYLTETGQLTAYAVDPPIADQIEFGGFNSDIVHTAHSI